MILPDLARTEPRVFPFPKRSEAVCLSKKCTGKTKVTPLYILALYWKEVNPQQHRIENKTVTNTFVGKEYGKNYYKMERTVYLRRTGKREKLFTPCAQNSYLFSQKHDTIKCICINKERTMKKLTSMYKRYMFHPILYKTVTRTSIVAVLMLLWRRYVSDGTFTIWEAPGFLCGVVLLIWAWVDYLRLDGVTIHHLLEEFKGMGKRQKKVHSTRSIIDYADEKIVSFEELEPEERTYCSLLSNLVLGLPLVAAALIASVL
jgi:hypothetical protein